ncbi:tRNA pseudouridine(55) synthase TruB [Parasulfuritortus cantonensis]|uniref:tRNA pseudouridine synthase B n=1 Tax=Parasulfuritortus cantonensis TaxID=2528202 RepID=A0A4R1BLE6_9PROT|nr:tRNA pseudouridine(55) synthase TruB [Parasulfuritortus cantonensis]TCJ18194.1 tRNA pseudouridine(55) synthase TruB [Parasulfuritortus cantonensis]
MAKRKVDGVLLLDKPEGITSNLALQKARRLFNAEKAGHTGTLDPFATGLLPLCLGEATKFSQFLLDADKVYLAELHLGVRTTTADPEGEVIETRPVAVTRNDIAGILPRFIGAIDQVPPMHSAIKRDGRPLYELARKGVEVERQARRVKVYGIELLGLAGDRLTVRVDCGKGVYVRTLAEDIGAALGCGAHLAALRREQVGPFAIEDAVSLAELEAMAADARDAELLPPDCLIEDLARLDLDVESAWQIRHGQAIWRAGLRVGDLLRLYDPAGRFLGVAEVDIEGKAAPKRLLATAP